MLRKLLNLFKMPNHVWYNELAFVIDVNIVFIDDKRVLLQKFLIPVFNMVKQIRQTSNYLLYEG